MIERFLKTWKLIMPGLLIAMSFLLLTASCSTVPVSDACPDPDLNRGKCLGNWQCVPDRRGCQDCACGPFYYEQDKVEEALTPIDIQ